MDIKDLSSKHFAECLHTRFAIQIPGGTPAEVELTEVAELHESPRQEQFSVLFHSAAGVRLPQAIYELDHEKLGRISLFLVPVGPRDGRGMDYQAAFNRVRHDGGSTA
jgi:hypothetical protein